MGIIVTQDIIAGEEGREAVEQTRRGSSMAVLETSSLTRRIAALSTSYVYFLQSLSNGTEELVDCAVLEHQEIQHELFIVG